MSIHDPFGTEGDRTIIKSEPSPGTTGAGTKGGHSTSSIGDLSIRDLGSNPLLKYASPLFAIATQLRHSIDHPDTAALQDDLAQEIQNFEVKTRQAGEPEANVNAARYVVCTMLDEFVLSTPWGVQGGWAQETLLVKFHNENTGGRKLFEILDKLQQDPARNINLLEFIYICLALGFEGRYRLETGGAAELEKIRHRLYETLRTSRGSTPRELSVKWRGAEFKQARLASYLPLWVLASIGLSLCLVTYLGFLIALNMASDPLSNRLATLNPPNLALDLQARTQNIPLVEPIRTLQSEIMRTPSLSLATRNERLAVNEQPGRSLVRIWDLFPSGQSAVNDSGVTLIRELGGLLKTFGGRIQIIGHTDNQPIRTLRFPSNWALSQQRALAVEAQLSDLVDSSRLSSEGRADTESLVFNDSPANRALNRRIELLLFYPQDEL